VTIFFFGPGDDLEFLDPPHFDAGCFAGVFPSWFAVGCVLFYVLLEGRAEVGKIGIGDVYFLGFEHRCGGEEGVWVNEKKGLNGLSLG